MESKRYPPNCPRRQAEGVRSSGDVLDLSQFDPRARATLDLLVGVIGLADKSNRQSSDRRLAYDYFLDALRALTMQYCTYLKDREAVGDDFNHRMLMQFIGSVSNQRDQVHPMIASEAVAVADAESDEREIYRDGFEPGSRSKADGSDFDRKAGQRLSKARAIAELSIEEAAKRLNVSTQALYKYEKGDRTIKAKLLYDAARAYDTNGNWLLCLTDVLNVTRRDDDGYLVTTTYRDPSSERRFGRRGTIVVN